jgi:hypothetical protein
MGIVLEPRGRRTSPIGSSYRATVSEDVTVDTSVYVIVNCKVQSCAVSKSPINSIINTKTLYSHTPYT